MLLVHGATMKNSQCLLGCSVVRLDAIVVSEQLIAPIFKAED